MIVPADLPDEPRPRDFAARQRRSHVRSLRARQIRRYRGRRAAALAAAVALPAFAAPGTWQGSTIDRAGLEMPAPRLPAERGSFPGSAFYYLSAEAPAVLDGSIHSDAANAPTNIDPAIGPVARALRIDRSGIDRSRALQCLTAAIYYEAASEPDSGQRAVAQVVLNRVAHPAYPKTVCGVVYQGSERTTGCQFSFTCDGSLARAPSRPFWLRAEAVAREALAGFVHAPIGLATHYHTVAIHPYWADSLRYVGTIGAHRFYRFGGAAGQLTAFRFAYFGSEPVAAPHPRATGLAPPESLPDPLAIQRAYDAGLRSAQITAMAPSATGLTPIKAAPPPAYAAELEARGGEAIYRGDRLPQATAIRPEYQQSGRWIAQPGT